MFKTIAHLSYCTSPSAGGHSNGGDLFSSLISRRIREDGITLVRIELRPCQTLQPGGIEHEKHDERSHCLKFGPTPPPSDRRSAIRRGQSILYLYREAAQGRPASLDAAVQAIADEAGVDAYLFDYIYGHLFFPWVAKTGKPYFQVTGNNESSFFKQWVRINGKKSLFWNAYDAYAHARFEKNIYRGAVRVVAISSKDLPDFIPESRKALITCHFDESPQRWRHTGSKDVFFVGNIGHYPNRMAIDYICRHIADRVYALDPEITFSILGARQTDFRNAHHPNVRFLGIGTDETAKSLFTASALLFCPIENEFGQKFKVVEAISHGTPFLASGQTMLGFPHLSHLPAFAMNAPESAANAIVELLQNPEQLRMLSERILEAGRSFAQAQKGIWRRTLGC